MSEKYTQLALFRYVETHTTYPDKVVFKLWIEDWRGIGYLLSTWIVKRS